MHTTRRIQGIYYLLLSLFWLGTALPMALQVLLAQARGLDLFQIGLLMGVYSLVIVLLEVPTGGLADAIGRKRAAVIAYSCMAVSSVVLLFAFSFPTYLLVFILNGLGRALASGALDAWFVDSLQAADPQLDLQPPLARAGTFSLLSLGLGTLLGSLLPRLFPGLPADGTAVLTPLSVPIACGGAVLFLLVILAILLVQEQPGPAQARGWQQGFRQVPVLIRSGVALTRHNRTLVLLLGASLASGLALISLESFWQPYFAALMGGGTENSLSFGLIMSGNFFVGMVGNLLATPISRLLNKRYGLVCAIFQGAWGLSIVGLALQTSTAPAVLLFWLAYLNMGVLHSPHSTLLNREIPSEQRSSMLSIASLASYIGSALGGIGLGYVAENSSIRTAWIFGGLVLVVSLGLYWYVDILQRTDRRSENAPVEA